MLHAMSFDQIVGNDMVILGGPERVADTILRLASQLDLMLRGDDMEIWAAIFFTDYSMAPTDLAVALEQRGFDSLWVAEHSHMPVTRRFTHPLGEAALTKEYFDVMDPFVNLERRSRRH
jgi:alkanesulfonate monooxygenase SsuD/methylene tetrahydromethanopterin reductase-like flavin-dependent oxidoreductase (luciferase family)